MIVGALFQYPEGREDPWLWAPYFNILKEGRTAYIGLESLWEYWAPVNQETGPDGIGNSAPLLLHLTKDDFGNMLQNGKIFSYN